MPRLGDAVLRGALGLLVATLAGCGPADSATLHLINSEQEEQRVPPARIDAVHYHLCQFVEWDPYDMETFDDEADLPEEGPVSIEVGQSHTFVLPPGCHDFRVARGTGPNAAYEYGRVILDVGETGTWTPYLRPDDEGWR